MGKSGVTLARAGCTTTDVSMSSDYFGDYRNPGECAKTLEYTADGRILWASIGKVFNKMTFHWREYEYNPSMIAEALKNPDKTCLLNVDKGGHWVLALTSLGFGKYWVADPYGGKKCIYGGVVGCAILKRK